MGSPSRVVSTGVGIVQLKSPDFIVASIHQSYTEWSTGSELCINMLLIADEFDEFFNINVFMLSINVSLSMKSSIIY